MNGVAVPGLSLTHTCSLPACLPAYHSCGSRLAHETSNAAVEKVRYAPAQTHCWRKQALTRTATNFVVSGATLCAPRLETWCTLLMRGWTSLWATLTCALHSDLRACQQASQRRGWGSRSRVAQAALMCLPSQHANPTAAVKHMHTACSNKRRRGWKQHCTSLLRSPATCPTDVFRVWALVLQRAIRRADTSMVMTPPCSTSDAPTTSNHSSCTVVHTRFAHRHPLWMCYMLASTGTTLLDPCD